MTDLLLQDMTAMAQMIRTKSLSPVELTKAAIERIESQNPKLNAFIKVMSDEALQQALLLEKEALSGNIYGPLHGVPIAVKDIFETEGVVTTAGSKVFENWVPNRDATVVARLKQAGAVIVGKTNLHEFAMGATNENPHYGATRNPWNLEKIPGGSSGGSGAAVAAGMCFGALGTDTAGSVRLPAAFCGITGLKPTYGAVSRFGCVPLSWSLDHIGPMTRSVKDAMLMMQALAGYDVKDQASSSRSIDFTYEPALTDLKGVAIGICRDYFFEDLDDEVQGLMKKSISLLEELGAEIREISLSGIAKALQSFRVILQSESYAFHQPIFAKREELYGEEIRLRFQVAKTVGAADYLHAQQTRNASIRQLLEAMQSIDVLVAPTNAKPPISIDSIPLEERAQNIFRLGRTPFANFVGFPAVSVPCGMLSDNLPSGIQFMGKPFADKPLLRIAECFQNANPWKPDYRSLTADRM